ncbi:MAG: tetratricopeptide repeat protein [Candidatus Omnitrophica bacterium]|nr:tetratricopeptide repeat protein [Candidatus Omnitrophota bacterium]
MQIRRHIKEILLISLLGLLIYFNSLQSGFIWDDYSLVVDNPLIRDIHKAARVFGSRLSVHGDIFYRPTQNLSYMLDFLLFKFDPRGYHLTNILLHIIVGILFFHLSNLLGKNRRVSLCAALLYLASPLWVESVTYISGRADILMSLFILMSFIFFIKKRILLCIICYIFALFSKEASLVYPLIILSYLLVWRKPDKKYITLAVLLCAITLIYGVTMLVTSWGVTAFRSESFPLSTRLLFLPCAIGKYLALIFFPANLHMSYTVRLPHSLLEPQVLLSVSLVGLLALAFFYYLKKDKFIAFFLLWFFIFFIPHSGIFPINAFFADHFIYLAAFGIFAVFLSLLDKLKIRWLFLSIFMIYLSYFSIATARYNSVWGEPARFYQRIIRLSENSFAAYNNLGVLYMDQGRLTDARRLFERSIEIKPDFVDARINLARGYYLQGDLKRATGLIRGVIQEDPDNAYAWNYLGTFSLKQGDRDMAEDSYIRACRLAPMQGGLLLDLYTLYSLDNRSQEAAEIKEKIASIDKYALAELYIRDSRYLLTIADLVGSLSSVDEALQINPYRADFYRLRGDILKEVGDYEGAFLQYKLVLKLSPSDWQAHNSLGELYLRIEFFEDARRCFEKALSLQPDSTKTQQNLQAVKGQLREAVEFRE